MATYYAGQFGITLSIVELGSYETNNNSKKMTAKRGKSVKTKAQ